MDTQKTTVVFRKWRNGSGGIIAIFPGQEGAQHHLCGCYEHVGQHGECSPLGLTRVHTLAAKPHEYDSLKKELEAIGYNLDVKERLTAKDYWWNKGATNERL